MCLKILWYLSNKENLFFKFLKFFSYFAHWYIWKIYFCTSSVLSLRIPVHIIKQVVEMAWEVYLLELAAVWQGSESTSDVGGPPASSLTLAALSHPWRSLPFRLANTLVASQAGGFEILSAPRAEPEFLGGCWKHKFFLYNLSVEILYVPYVPELPPSPEQSPSGPRSQLLRPTVCP